MKIKVLGLIAVAAVVYSCATKAVVQSTPKSEVKTIVLTAELEEGKDLYENNCAKCHPLFEPSSHTKEEWKPIVTRMQRKAKLDDAQGASIYNYITYSL